MLESRFWRWQTVGYVRLWGLIRMQDRGMKEADTERLGVSILVTLKPRKTPKSLE